MGETPEVPPSPERQRLWNRAFWASLMVFEVVGWLLAYQS